MDTERGMTFYTIGYKLLNLKGIFIQRNQIEEEQFQIDKANRSRRVLIEFWVPMLFASAHYFGES